MDGWLIESTREVQAFFTKVITQIRTKFFLA